MAYRTDGTANFNFFINRQGPRGPQGIQGPDGFSPNIQVEEDQGNTFTLRITNKDNFFITSNLREHKEDRGGDYIRYDRAGQLMYIGDPDFATTVKAGEVRLSTADDLAAGSNTVALTPKVYKDDITSIKAEIQGDIAATNLKIDATNKNVSDISNKVTKLDNNTVKLDNEQTISGTKTFTSETKFTTGINTSFVNDANAGLALQLGFGEIKAYTPIRDASSNTLYLNQSSVTAGDNTVIEKTSNGIKISSTAQGDVTLAGDNSFTGNNTFSGISTFNGDTWINSLKIGASLKNQQGKKFLDQSSITAGNNITIEETTDGVKISSTTGGGGAGGTNAGLEGDYCSKYGVVDCPNGILTEDTGKVTLNAGVVMQLTETDGLTTNASAMAHDITSTVDFDLFYTSASLLEATQVVFSEQEPDNGTTGVLAWYNGSQWQFKSNDTGNVWKSAPAVRLAHIHITDGNITRIDYIGNRHLNKVIPVTTDTEQTITGLKTFSASKTNFNAIEVNGRAHINSLYVTNTKISKLQLRTEVQANSSYFSFYNGAGYESKFGIDTARDCTYISPYYECGNLYINNYADNSSENGIATNLILSGVIKNKVNNITSNVLTQKNVTAGSDNLVISDTTDGIQIVCNAPTNAQLGQLQELIADLSTKINNLTDRVRALEEQIDGGIA